MDNKGNFISRSLQVKLVLAVGLCLVFVSGLIIGYSAWVSYNDTVDNARQSAVKEAQFQMEQIKVRFNKAFDAARTMRDMIAAYKIKGQTAIPDRAYINDMLRTVLNQDSSFFGTYTLWEPDFDGKDADFANKPNYDSTGRLIPYWNRGGSNGEIRLDPIVGYDQPGLGDFYLIPRKTLKETIIDPFAYPVGDKNILMASLITPVVVDGKFYGITGVDMTLDTLQQMADSVDIYNKSGKVELISHTGIIAASSGQSQ